MTRTTRRPLGKFLGLFLGLFPRLFFVLLAGALLAGLQACGDAGTTDRNKAQIRLVNATGSNGGYAQLALRLNDELRQGQVAYGDNALYAEVDDGSPTLTIHNQNSATALLTANTSLSKGRYYSSLAFGAVGALRQLLLDDNQGEPDANKALLRVINAAPDSGPLDVYLTGADESLLAAVPVQASAGYGTLGGWLTVASTGWRLRVTAANNKNDLRLDVTGLNLASRQIGTLVLTPGSGGVLASALLLTQRGGITRVDNAQARVRVVAGLDGAGAVTADVGGTRVANGVASPSVSSYALVPTVNPALALSVGGAAAPVSSVGGPSAGADLTLLVQGSTSVAAQQAGAWAPRGIWIADDNRAPSDINQVRIRLVNGLSSEQDFISMSVDFFGLGGRVASGKASGYELTDPGTTLTLRVTREGDAAPLYTATGQTLVAGGTYSVFIVGSAAAPVAIVRRDR